MVDRKFMALARRAFKGTEHAPHAVPILQCYNVRPHCSGNAWVFVTHKWPVGSDPAIYDWMVQLIPIPSDRASAVDALVIAFGKLIEGLETRKFGSRRVIRRRETPFKEGEAECTTPPRIMSGDTQLDILGMDMVREGALPPEVRNLPSLFDLLPSGPISVQGNSVVKFDLTPPPGLVVSTPASPVASPPEAYFERASQALRLLRSAGAAPPAFAGLDQVRPVRPNRPTFKPAVKMVMSPALALRIITRCGATTPIEIDIVSRALAEVVGILNEEPWLMFDAKAPDS